ncbi:MAG TPA: hypothetical protein VK557_07650 [Pyrinomonadaceae bacterium]|nr:hypothetical protein [Pyrinomonadaceae bacterium]
MEKTNLEQYAQLRTLLDSLEIGALRYYLDPQDPRLSQQHYDYLIKALKPIIDKIWDLTATSKKKPLADPCPEGMYWCNGCCIPYPCIGISLDN